MDTEARAYLEALRIIDNASHEITVETYTLGISAERLEECKSGQWHLIGACNHIKSLCPWIDMLMPTFN